jgi:poly(3-hydroxybutyrate) depolymerase
MLPLIAVLIGCNSEKGSDSAEEGRGWLTAELAELSSGECPDMSESGETSTFVSSGEERTVTTVHPSSPDGPMRIVFFYHGLMDPGSTPNPTGYMANAMDLQEMADEHNAVIVLPQSRVWSMLGMEFFMWDVEDGTSDNDLALYDDLRTCIAEGFDVDLDKAVVFGFSGGALFTTVVLTQRSDTLAAAVEMSGGADIEMATFENKFSRYETPENPLPVLLAEGGSSDVWPDSSFTLLDFHEATDTLQSKLLADGHYVVRCSHSSGHTITWPIYEVAIEWLTGHSYGQPSPFEGDIGAWESWCEVAE